nr:MAG TPA: hypothetical protein [Caudoviricetes sp.]
MRLKLTPETQPRVRKIAWITSANILRPYVASPLSQHCWGRGVFLLFGLVLAWPSAADTTAGALRVPLVDGLGEPAARAADGHVRLGQVVGGGVRDAQAFRDLFDAEVFSRHRPSCP